MVTTGQTTTHNVTMTLVVSDTDHDGLPDTSEGPWCTSENDPDSDDDGLCDGDTQVAGATVVCARGEGLDKDGPWTGARPIPAPRTPTPTWKATTWKP